MQEKVIILSAEQYFNKYAVEGIGKGSDRWMIRRQLIDAFHKEIFGLVAMRTKKPYADILPEGDPEAMKIAKNIIHDATHKWVKLCKMFAKFKETAGLLNENDLKMYDEIEDIGTTAEELMEQQEAEEDVGDKYEGEEAPDDPDVGETDGEDRGADEDSERYSAGTKADEQAPAEEVNSREEHAE